MKIEIFLRWLRGACAGLMFGSGMLFFTGCVATVSTPGAAVYYDYDYYPGVDVYYYPAGRVYYWREGSAWRSGRELPTRIAIREGHSEHFRGHSQQPWMERH